MLQFKYIILYHILLYFRLHITALVVKIVLTDKEREFNVMLSLPLCCGEQISACEILTLFVTVMFINM